MSDHSKVVVIPLHQSTMSSEVVWGGIIILQCTKWSKTREGFSHHDYLISTLMNYYADSRGVAWNDIMETYM